MLGDKIEKIQKKNLESTGSTLQIRDPSHETEITS